MKLSTRNQLPATVDSVTTGEAMAVVKMHLAGGQPLTASITKEAVAELGLTAGANVVVLIKSTEVTIGVE